MTLAHHFRPIVLLALFVCLTGTTPARAQCADWRAGPLDDGIAPNGTDDGVTALLTLPSDGVGTPALVAAGYFTSIQGVPANGIAIRDGSSGQWNALGNGFGDGGVTSLTVYNGDLVAAGYTFGGVGVSNVVKRWVPASQAWQTLAFADAGIHAITVYDGDLIAAGGFTSIGGVAARQVARRNGSTWQQLGAGLSSPGQPNVHVKTLAVYLGELVAGGNMWSNQAGHLAPIARWNGITWSYPWGGPYSAAWGAFTEYVDFTVDALGVNHNHLYVAGANRMAFWDGSAWSDFPYVSGSVGAFTLYGDDVIMGGSFTDAGGVAANNIVAWNGSAFFALGAGIGNPGGVSALTAYYDGLNYDLITGGLFTTAGGKSANHLARWNGSAWINFGGGTVSAVNAFATLGSRIIAAGDIFQSTNVAQVANNVVEYDGAELSPLGSGLNSGAYALKGYSPSADNHELVAEGRFTMAGGVSANYIARWLESSFIGSPPPHWEAMGSGFNNWVLAVERMTNSYVAGGLFTQSGATTANRVAVWNESTDTWTQIQGGTNGTVRALKSYLQTQPFLQYVLIAGGDFSTAGGATANRIAVCTQSAFGGSFSAWSPMGSGFSGGIVYAIERHAGSTYAGGSFTTSGGTTLNRIGRWTGSAWVPVGTGVGFNQPVFVLKSSGPNLYAAGAFTSVDGIAVNRIARWNGTNWSAVPAGTESSIIALHLYNGELQVGGYFDTVNNGALVSPSWGRYLETGTPWIVSQPIAQSTDCGGTANFYVEPAQGYDALNYQWRKDGTPVVLGATATGSVIASDGPTLTIADVSHADEGTYDCVISNVCGDATSTGASLTVSLVAADGDGDGNGAADGNDIAGYILTVQGLTFGRGRCAYDMNVDGVIDLDDLPLFADLLVNDDTN
ncbi:MAG TPA: immunoglobulin domain-containing protein [Phycisphaerae bacterium]|nr:immunoglobulin domain-containing protein [Phycisphaerae bacterium]